MTEEQAFALADPDGGVYIPGAFVMALGTVKAEQQIADAFRTGTGMAWHEHDEGVFIGCEQFFRPAYIASLVPSWIPALDGAENKLRAGTEVADIGCGLGASTILLATEYPNSSFATDTVGGNLNPVGRVYYNASTMLCVPNALSQPGGYTLGAQAGEAAIRQVVTDAALGVSVSVPGSHAVLIVVARHLSGVGCGRLLVVGANCRWPHPGRQHLSVIQMTRWQQVDRLEPAPDVLQTVICHLPV